MLLKSPRLLLSLAFFSFVYVFYHQNHRIVTSYLFTSEKASEVSTSHTQHQPTQGSDTPDLKTYGGIGSGDSTLPADYHPDAVDKVGAYNSALANLENNRPDATRVKPLLAEPTKNATQLALDAANAANEAVLWSTDATPFHTSDRVGLIIEDRPLPNLIPIILHFASVLGPNWPIIFYTKSSKTTFTSPAFNRLIKSGQVIHRHLPDFVLFDVHAAVSVFMTKPWLWNQLAPAKHVFIFQADSIICSKAEQTVDDFIEWDFIGAPISPSFGHGYNGGLSLRNRERMLSVIMANTFANDDEANGEKPKPEARFEDQWFYSMLKALAPNADGTPGAKLPDVATSKKFAVETIYYEKPLGYHQIRRWQKNKMKEVLEWCPEVKLCEEELFVLGGQTPEDHAAGEKARLALEWESANLEKLVKAGEAKLNKNKGG